MGLHDPVKKREYMQTYRERHPERVRASKRASSLANPEATRARRVSWKAANPERSREIERKGYYKRKFGITVEQYDEMLAAQNGACGICSKPPEKKRLAIDHDHETGAIRGLLCVPCNAALGVLEALLEEAKTYLAKGKAEADHETKMGLECHGA